MGGAPPPPPPPGGGGGTGSQNSEGRLSSGSPGVTAAPGKVFLVIGGIVLLIVFIAYLLIGEDEKKKPPKREERTIARPKQPAPSPAPPQLPPRPPDPPAQQPPPALPQPSFSLPEEEIDTEQRQARLRSEMLAYSGDLLGSGQTDAERKAREADDRQRRGELAATDNNLAFARAARRSDAPSVEAGKIENIRATIAQGKLIHAVLETAINTQLPGNVRAVVSRDIYAEAGNKVLIPRGSRLVGVYNTNLFRGQGRVFVIWNRLIRPDGIDVMINSNSTDNLGRAGVSGFVNNRYGQMFAAAGLSSILSIGIAAAGEEIAGGEGTTQSIDPNGSVVTTSQSSDQAVLGAASRFGSVGERISTRIFDFRPIITIDQGTPIKVFVSRDLLFPAELTGGTRVLP